MNAVCVLARDPYVPWRNAEVRALSTPSTLTELARAMGNVPHMAWVDGVPRLRADWGKPILEGEFVIVQALPQGGGGGGSDPLRIVLLIAVALVAPYAAGLLANTFVGTTIFATFGQAGLMALPGIVGFAGSMLVNALIPPPRPPSPQQAAALAAPSPTYNLQAQGNSARLGAAIPVQYGRMLAYPDFAAQPYVEYAGNEQYLYQLLCLGQGEYDIEAIRIEDTPIANFGEIEIEIVPPGGALTLFPANVVTAGEVSGQELDGVRAATYSQSGTTLTVTLAGHGLSAGRAVYLDATSGALADGAQTIAAAPTQDTFTVAMPAPVTTSGNVNVHTYTGAFAASGPGSAANALAFDFVLSRGLYRAEDDGSLSFRTINYVCEARRIDDFGNPLAAWQTLGTHTVTDKTTTPQRFSRRYSLTGGRYECRVRRSSTKDSDTRVGNDLLWGGLRAYLPETASFGDVTMIAVRARATNNLSGQAARKINVIATRKLPVWDGSAWSAPVATRSIAWAIADACRNTSYGAGLPDARVDLVSLLALDAVWAARGDEFNGRFDAAMGFWEALSKISGAGRAKAYLQGGIVRVARDGPVSVPVALFSMRNITRGSFNVDYLMPDDDTADAVDVTYFDGDVWQPRSALASLPGSHAERPAKVELFGVTSRQQAYREALYHAASNRYRRRLIKFETEMDGFTPSPGDLIAVQHDMPAWGQFAEVTGWNPVTLELAVSEPLQFGSGTHYLALRTVTGGVSGPHRAVATADPRRVILAEIPDTEPYAGQDYERTHVVFGPGESWRQPARVVAIRPRGLYKVEIEAINEDPSVHTADEGRIAPPIVTSQLAVYRTAPVIENLTLASSLSDPARALLSWTPAPGASIYHVEMAEGASVDDAASWTRIAETSANNLAVAALYGARTIIRVRGVGLAAGPWASLYYGASADYMWAADDSVLMWSADDTTLMWTT